ncbi:MAG: hypothetical protein A4E35_01071 [Methanoregula sp. PtaU1.Bin051]|nr:MAG: hypothetical protein A4E35_01071 [Methanoregula sp. PtaU1.Bin051]
MCLARSLLSRMARRYFRDPVRSGIEPDSILAQHGIGIDVREPVRIEAFCNIQDTGNTPGAVYQFPVDNIYPALPDGTRTTLVSEV